MVPESGIAPATLIFVNRYFHPDESATSQMLTDLAVGLAAAGRQVRVICSRTYSSLDRTLLPGDDCVQGVQVRRVSTTRFGRGSLAGRALDYLTFYFACAWLLWRTARAADVIIAKTDPPLISVVCALVARLRRARLVNWQQDVFPEVAVALAEPRLISAISPLLTAWRDRAMRSADMNVVIGERMLEHFARRSIPADKLCLIPNWGLATALRSTADSRLRSSLGLEREFVVCYSGNLGRAHEYQTLLGAAELLRDDPAIAMLIIGGGARMDAFRRAVAARELCNVQFMPAQPRENLVDSLSAADVHVVCLLPQLEGLVVPSKFYGVLSVGRPVIFIGDPRGELAAVVDATACGFAVATHDAQALAESIRTLRDLPALRAAMGRRARTLLFDSYTLSHGLARWQQLLTRLLAPASQQLHPHDANNHAGILKPS